MTSFITRLYNFYDSWNIAPSVKIQFETLCNNIISPRDCFELYRAIGKLLRKRLELNSVGRNFQELTECDRPKGQGTRFCNIFYSLSLKSTQFREPQWYLSLRETLCIFEFCWFEHL